jgi:hypothetical protein
MSAQVTLQNRRRLFVTEKLHKKGLSNIVGGVCRENRITGVFLTQPLKRSVALIPCPGLEIGTWRSAKLKHLTHHPKLLGLLRNKNCIITALLPQAVIDVAHYERELELYSQSHSTMQQRHAVCTA